MSTHTIEPGRILLMAMLTALTMALMPSCNEPEYACTEQGAQSLFTQRIMPVLTDDRPKSCNQCHLSGVDLSLFVQSSPCQTMACMVDEGLVDLAAPSESRVLSWIAQASPQSEGITAQVIDEEYQGFLQWIEHTASCGQQHCPTYDNPCERTPPETQDCALPNLNDEWEPFHDPGGCDDIVLEEMFQNDFYAFRGRCHPCHWSTNEALPQAPKWLIIGECDVASLATLRQIEERGYIDIDDPLASEILLKPLAEELGGVEHGGGPKFHDPTEEGYLAFVHFLERYAACKR